MPPPPAAPSPEGAPGAEGSPGWPNITRGSYPDRVRSAALEIAVNELARDHLAAFAATRDGELRVMKASDSEVLMKVWERVLAQHDFESSAAQAFHCRAAELDVRVATLELSPGLIIAVIALSDSDWAELEASVLTAKRRWGRSIAKGVPPPVSSTPSGGHGAEAFAGVAKYLPRKKPS